jgi:type VI secretion system protein ImpH
MTGDDRLGRPAIETEFFELVRLLERILGCDAGRLDDLDARPPIGFAHVPDLGFPASDVAFLVEGERSQGDGAGWSTLDGERATVGTTFLGVVGTASPLTPEWTEEVLLSDEEGALRTFYDVFHDRALRVLFHAWKTKSLEGAFDLEGGDALSKRLRSLVGVDSWAPVSEPVEPMAAVGLGDFHRAQPQTIDIESAQGILRHLFPDWNLRVEANAPRFVRFAPSERARLGEARCRLGEDLVYGDGYVDREGLVRIHVGPVNGATYESLMPGGRHYVHVRQLAEWAFAAVVDVELEVQVAAEETPRCVLDGRPRVRLGVDARYTTERGGNLRVRVPLCDDPHRVGRMFVE